MKAIAATAFCVLGLTAASQASFTVEIDAGILRNSTGTAVVPVGGLLQLIASPSGSAANLSPANSSSFTTGDNIIVAQFAMNNNGGRVGQTGNFLNGLTLQNTSTSTPTTFDQGDPLELRWYPTLTLGATSPGLGTTYGRFRTDTSVDGGVPWLTPADNTSTTLLVLATAAAAGTQPETAGFAINVVTPVPEPSSMILLAGAAFGVAGLRAWRNRK